MLFKQAAEVERVLKAEAFGYFRNGHKGVLQQCFRLKYYQTAAILYRRLTGDFFKLPYKIALAYLTHFRVFLI